MDGVGSLGRRAIFSLDPETAHRLSLLYLRFRPGRAGHRSDPRLAVSVAGIDFPNPLGMAAGYDKNAENPDGLLRLGFGFAEVGTLTPLPQAGNPRPRVFRLVKQEAVINRLGFNNQGHAAAGRRLAARQGRGGIVGVNIGANRDSPDRLADYELGVARFAGLASYLAVNVSSPNTPGLRNMQARQALAELLGRVAEARRKAADPARRAPPIFLKIAPDLQEPELADIAAQVLEHGIEGVIVSNTSVGRPGLPDDGVAAQAGGLSGRPLFARSTAVLARMRKLLGGKTAIVGVGGVDRAEAALEKIRAGADLVQLYTGMIYGGPALPARILSGLSHLLDVEGVKTIAELRDSRLDHWLRQPLG